MSMTENPTPDPDDVDLVAQLETAVKDSYRNGYADGLADAKISELRLGGNPFRPDADEARDESRPEHAGCFIRWRDRRDGVFPPYPPLTLALAAWILYAVEDSEATGALVTAVGAWLFIAALMRFGLVISARHVTRGTTDDKRDGE